MSLESNRINREKKMPKSTLIVYFIVLASGLILFLVMRNAFIKNSKENNVLISTSNDTNIINNILLESVYPNIKLNPDLSSNMAALNQEAIASNATDLQKTVFDKPENYLKIENENAKPIYISKDIKNPELITMISRFFDNTAESITKKEETDWLKANNVTVDYIESFNIFKIMINNDQYALRQVNRDEIVNFDSPFFSKKLMIYQREINGNINSKVTWYLTEYLEEPLFTPINKFEEADIKEIINCAVQGLNYINKLNYYFVDINKVEIRMTVNALDHKSVYKIVDYGDYNVYKTSENTKHKIEEEIRWIGKLITKLMFNIYINNLNMSEDLNDFINKCLNDGSFQTIENLIEHPFISNKKLNESNN